MKASELIIQLQAAIKEHGDLTVWRRDDTSTGEVEKVQVSEAGKDWTFDSDGFVDLPVRFTLE